MQAITLYQAKKVITMDPRQPEATHVAVQDGKILAVGDAHCADQWGDVTHSIQFADTVLMPGFVEGHAHMMAGAIWQYAYAGYHDRVDPAGVLWKGLTTLEQVIEGLTEYAATLAPDTPLIAWGFDPIFLPNERLNRHHLDQISAERPVAVLFSNFHLMCVNSKALEMAGYDADTEAEGVIKDTSGEPSGELQEMAAMFPIMRRLGIDFRALTQTESAIRSYAEVAKRAGVTTVTDLWATIEGDDLALLQQITAEDDFPLRIVPALGLAGGTPEEMADKALALKAQSSDKLRLGAVKLMTDGSIQGWTARVKWPGYVGGQANGLWNTAPAQIFELCKVMHAAGIQMHLHVNGDEAAEVAIDAIEAAMQHSSWSSHRHVLQHGQMMNAAQFKRCAELGIAVNLFANHLWYFGDQHAALTIGHGRACRMDATRSALEAGVVLAIHSDAPVTPMGPLFTAWCAANRQTMSGQILGEAERLSAQEALYAITMGAAQTLKLDAEIGSIEVGKRADFAVLGADPTACAVSELKDIPVLGTVVDGRPHLL